MKILDGTLTIHNATMMCCGNKFYWSYDYSGGSSIRCPDCGTVFRTEYLIKEWIKTPEFEIKTR